MSYPGTVHNCSLQREQWRSASTKKPAGAGFAVVVKGVAKGPQTGQKVTATFSLVLDCMRFIA